jgi:hypothetical protein
MGRIQRDRYDFRVPFHNDLSTWDVSSVFELPIVLIASPFVILISRF